MPRLDFLSESILTFNFFSKLSVLKNKYSVLWHCGNVGVWGIYFSVLKTNDGNIRPVDVDTQSVAAAHFVVFLFEVFVCVYSAGKYKG